MAVNYKFGNNSVKVYTGKKKASLFKKSFSYLGRFGFANSLLLFVGFFIVFNIINSTFLELRLSKQSSLLKDEYTTVKKEHDNLTNQLKFFQSNEGVEKLAREKLGFIKDNEIPIHYFNVNNK